MNLRPPFPFFTTIIITLSATLLGSYSKQKSTSSYEESLPKATKHLLLKSVIWTREKLERKLIVFYKLVVGFYGISTLVGYLMSNTLLYIHIKDIYIFFDCFFFGISTIVYHLMPNHLCTYISNTYDLVWLCFMAYQSL